MNSYVESICRGLLIGSTVVVVLTYLKGAF